MVYLQFSKSQRLIARLLLIVYLLESCQIFNNSPVLQSYKQEHRLSITNSFISKETANLLEDHIVITKQGEQIKFKKTANGTMQATVIENLGGTLSRAYILPIYIDPALRITETTIKNKGWQTQFIHVIDNRVHIAQTGLLGGGKEKEGTVIHVTSTTSSQKPLKRNRADKGKEITEKSKRRKLQEEDSEGEPTEEEKRVFQLGESMKIKGEPTEKETGPMYLEAITANVDAQYQYEQGEKHERLSEDPALANEKESNFSKAITCYKRAAEAGHLEAQQKLISFRNTGQYSNPHQEAMKWYKDAINRAANSWGKTSRENKFSNFTEFIQKADATEAPLKLSDLIVMELDATHVPTTIEWGGISTRNGKASHIFAPIFTLPNIKKYDDKGVIAIDVAGPGLEADEIAYCVAKRSGEYYFIVELGSIVKDSEDKIIEQVGSIIRRHKDVLYIVYERNGAGCYFGKPVKDELNKYNIEVIKLEKQKKRSKSSNIKDEKGEEEEEDTPKQVKVLLAINQNSNNTDTQKGEGKITRIISTLEPLLNSHKLIIDLKILQEDFQRISQPEVGDLNCSFFYQLLTIGAKGAQFTSQGFSKSTHDDRIDALAIAIQHLRDRKEKNQTVQTSPIRKKRLPLKDIKKHQKAAEQGDINAYYKLGEIYEKQEASEYFVTAFNYYSIAAVRGHQEAQYKLGQMYGKGLGVERNEIRAIKWYKRGAQKGHIPAQVFQEAVKWGHLEIIHLLIQKGAKVNIKDQNGHTALYIAVKEGHLNIAKLLIENKASIYTGNPLHGAAKGGHLEIVNLLIQKGVNVNAKDQNGYTALYEAAKEGHLEVVKLLIEKGADVSVRTLLHGATCKINSEIANLIIQKEAKVNDKDNNGNSLLHLASEKGHINIANLLIDKGANINDKDKNGYSPLHWAAQNGHLDITRLLIETEKKKRGKKEAYISVKDKYDASSLHLAALKGHPEVVDLLLQEGANINDKDKNGYSPLHWAAQNGRLNVVGLLLKNRADIEAKDKYDASSLHLAALKGHLEVVDLLLQEGANINDKDKNGYSPLHWAAQNGRLNVVDLLLQKGSDINDKGNNGYSPLHWAAQNGRLNVVDLLLQKGSDINDKDNNGYSPLHWAAQNGRLNVVDLLLKNRADIEAKDKDGYSSLHWAALKGYLDVVDLLLKNRADIEAKDKDGYSPLHWAAFKGQVEVVKVLLENGANVNSKDKNDYLPLHWAAMNNHIKVVKFLLGKEETKVNDKNNQGLTPLQVAKYKDHTAISELLTKKIPLKD